jgi:tellurite resistance-related uncharacterized protein
VKTLPAAAEPYRRTPEFTETSVPAALLRRHDTKAGIWGRIEVIEGELLYRILEPIVEEHLLRPGLDGVVEPEVPHEVEPRGPVRFFVEFARVPE